MASFRKGHRKYGGRKNGSKNKSTLEREAVLSELKQSIMQQIQPTLQAALDSAQGLTVMYQKKKVKNKKTGKYERIGELVQVKDQARVHQLLRGDCSGEDWYYITTKDPNVTAIRELWDRAFGKPEQPIKHSGDELHPIRERIEFAYLVQKSNEQKGTGKNNNQ